MIAVVAVIVVVAMVVVVGCCNGCSYCNERKFSYSDDSGPGKRNISGGKVKDA